MKRLFSAFLTVLLCLSAAMTLEQRAHAYVDPGSGLLVFQIVGTLVTGTVLWFRRRIKNLFGLGDRSGPGSSSVNQSNL